MPSWKKVVLIDKDATLNELTLNQVNNTTGDFITITNQGVISKRTPTQTLQDIGAGTSSTIGTVTSVSAGTQINGMDMTITNGTTTPSIATSVSNAANFRTSIGAGTGNGTVTSVTATAGTGISISGSPITTSGTLTITNSAPHIATNLGITPGNAAGPIVTSSTGTNATLPTASNTASGVVTTGAQTWAGTKTFSSAIAGSITGTSSNVTGTVAISNGGTGATTAAGARTNLQVENVVNLTVNTARTTAAKTTVESVTFEDGTVYNVNFTLGTSVTNATLNGVNIQLGTTNVSTVTLSTGTSAVVIPMRYNSSTNKLNIYGSHRTSDSTEDFNMRWENSVIAGEEITRYKLIMEGTDGRFYPLTIGNTTAATKTVSTREFRLDGTILMYNTTPTQAENAVFSTVWVSEYSSGRIHYTFNQSSGFDAYKQVYLVGTINANGNFVLDNTTFTSWLTQTLPTTDDGKVYVYLGITNNTTTAFRLDIVHTIYQYKDGKLRTYAGFAESAAKLTTARTLTIGNTGKTFNGSTNVAWSLSEIGAQASLTNPVTGTGTNNFLPKFTSTGSTLGNSLVFDNGTNIGIGTTTPSEKLEVTDDILVNGVRIGRGGGNQATNTRVGFSALLNNTTGHSNTATGRDALLNSTTGANNTANGFEALLNNTTGGNNTANGRGVLFNNTTGNFNTANGVNALLNNTTGVNNTANGVNALLSNTTGASNTANGFQAGRFIANGSTANTITNNSVFIGSNTRALANNQTNQIVIGHDAIGIGSNSVVLGNASIVTTALRGNVGIGTTSPSQKLHVVGNGLFTGTLEVDIVNNGVGDFLTRTAGGIITRRTAAQVRTDIGAGTGNGTVTSITAGDGLSGGTITASGTITVDGTVVRTFGNQTIDGTKTFSGAATFSNANAITLSNTQAGVIRFNSTTNRTAQLFADGTTSGNTKTINLGTGGASGSTTNITLGSDTKDSKNKIRINNSFKDNNSASGEITNAFGGTGFDAGDLVYLNSSGNWVRTRANAVGTSTGLLGITLGTTGKAGVLLRGFASYNTPFPSPGLGFSGLKAYISDGTTLGRLTYTAPDSPKSVVRIIGYSTGTGGGIYFCPDTTWVEID